VLLVYQDEATIEQNDLQLPAEKRQKQEHSDGISILCAHIGSTGDHDTKCRVTTVYNTRASALRSYDPMTHCHPYTSGSYKRLCLPSPALLSLCVIPQLGLSDWTNLLFVR